MTSAVVYDEVFKTHDTGQGHPESPQRCDAVMNALRGADFAGSLKRLEPRAATGEEIERCHAQQYVKTATRDIQSGQSVLSSGDTAICRDSLTVAFKAAGGACVAVDAVMESQARNVFCVLRPPGHHATPTRGMGFCIFNNVAVAARYAQQKYKVGKVLIVDWDVHHGNGTQDIFYEDGSVFFFSTHQSPLYPGTGARDETGRGEGKGTTLNRPFPAGASRREIVGAFRDDLLPAVQRFKPEFVFISAGFDSRRDDPLGQFLLTDDDFVELTDIVLEIARDYAEERVVSVLEGGYNLPGLASAALAHCRKLQAG
jgi:acetoin utilization deacetylase AcuC-like enzyme